MTLTPPLRYILAVHALAIGAGYALGPAKWSTGNTFAVVHQLPIPVWAWGALFFAAGLCLLIQGNQLVTVPSGSWFIIPADQGSLSLGSVSSNDEFTAQYSQVQT